MPKKVLVIAAHPDDEVLGCGGTMARHANAGDKVATIFLTDGEGARQTSNVEDTKLRASAAVKANALLGSEILLHENFPDNGLDTVPFLQLVQAVEDVALAFNPNIIYTHFAGDLNKDHQLVREVAMTIFRPQPGQPRPDIYAFKVLSSTGWQGAGVAGFNPGHFVDISAYQNQKMEALAAYDSEMRPAPHARSLEAVRICDQHTGNLVGFQAAESFVAERSFG